MNIKRCPFCAAEAKIKDKSYAGIQLYCVQCTICAAKTTEYIEQSVAADAWNSRIEENPSEADRWLKEATEQRARAELAEAQRDELAEYLEAIKRGLAYGGK